MRCIKYVLLTHTTYVFLIWTKVDWTKKIDDVTKTRACNVKNNKNRTEKKNVNEEARKNYEGFDLGDLMNNLILHRKKRSEELFFGMTLSNWRSMNLYFLKMNLCSFEWGHFSQKDIEFRAVPSRGSESYLFQWQIIRTRKSGDQSDFDTDSLPPLTWNCFAYKIKLNKNIWDQFDHRGIPKSFISSLFYS